MESPAEYQRTPPPEPPPERPSGFSRLSPEQVEAERRSAYDYAAPPPLTDALRLHYQFEDWKKEARRSIFAHFDRLVGHGITRSLRYTGPVGSVPANAAFLFCYCTTFWGGPQIERQTLVRVEDFEPAELVHILHALEKNHYQLSWPQTERFLPFFPL